VRLRFVPTESDHNVRVRFYKDYATTPVVVDASNGQTYYDLNVAASGGFTKLKVPGESFNVLQVEMENLEPRNSFIFTRWWPRGTSADREVVY
ncbi:MAG: hypothetical protein MN733_21985, partial [Nitrososphaera sp.]|nr:hypothetical protein [Nitrososphaera sp.]